MRSKLDPTHITQMTYDENSEAVKVKIQDAEMSIELSANDGDSVTSHPVKLVASAMGCDITDNNMDVIPALDCSSLKEVRIDIEGTGTAQILASPVDSGDFFYVVGPQAVTHRICARRIKVKSLDVVGNVHLVGRS